MIKKTICAIRKGMVSISLKTPMKTCVVLKKSINPINIKKATIVKFTMVKFLFDIN